MLTGDFVYADAHKADNNGTTTSYGKTYSTYQP